MSYILDALRKAEQERTLGQVPELKTMHTPLRQPSERHWSKILLGLVLAINGVALLAVLFIKYEETFDIARLTSATPELENLARSRNSPRMDSSFAEQSELPSPSPRKSTSVAALTQPPVSPSSVVEDFSSSESIQRMAAAVPPWSQPTLESPGAMPALHLDIHVYDETQSNSFVVINSARYREGEQLQEGPLLESIRADGVVLSYQGRRFRLPVGP